MAVVIVIEGALSLASAYLLLLLAAARAPGRRPPPAPDGEGLRFLVLVPAHDEEALVGETVRSLLRMQFPPDRFDVLVVADNCGDRTAEVARAAGAQVAVRRDPSRRGKGEALAWALTGEAARRAWDVVTVVDADCRVSPDLLAAIEARIARGAAAVQVSYLVDNPEASTAAALRFAGFALVNHVRPLGSTRLGWSCGILGSGFALTRRLAERHPWRAASLAEDQEHHARLVAAGERVVFAPEAGVRSAMPTSHAAARTQNLRWEQGRWHVARRWVPRLVARGGSRREAAPLATALDLVIPPQSLMLAGNMATLALAASLRSPRGVGLAIVNLVAQVAYVLGGLRTVGAPAPVYRALARAPGLVAFKLGIHLRVLARRGSRSWVPTRAGTP